MTNDTWLTWCKAFVEETKPTEADPVLLIADQHDSRTDTLAINYLADNHVTLLCLPPHTTHRLQPLDVSFFGPFKKHLRKLALKASGGGSVDTSKAATCGYIRDALAEVSKYVVDPVNGTRSSTLISAFKTTGIVPFNPSVLGEEEFAVSDKLARDRMQLALEGDIIDLSAVESFDPKDVKFSEDEVKSISRSVLVLPAPVRATLKKLNDKFAATRRQPEVMTGADYVERTLAKMKAAEEEALEKQKKREEKKEASRMKKEAAEASKAERAEKKLAREAARAAAAETRIAQPVTAPKPPISGHKRKRHEASADEEPMERQYAHTSRDRAQRRRVTAEDD